MLCRYLTMASPQSSLTRSLAAAFLSGPFDVDQLVQRGSCLLGKRWRWLRPLATRVCAHFADDILISPRIATVAAFIAYDSSYQRAVNRHTLQIVDRSVIQPVMRPMPAARDWSLPEICTVPQLANWLGVTTGELHWFADRKGLGYHQRELRRRHYHFRTLSKRFGHVRMIESPKPRLKQLQQQILEEILNRIPPHESAHGFRRGRSVKTFAIPHLKQRVVLRIDLQDFFVSIREARVEALFRSVGYPEPISDLLAALCTHRTPIDAWTNVSLSRLERERAMRFYAQPHLPQGAPTSPSVANLCAYRMDCRVAAFAQASGANYTRYADDLAFSGQEMLSRSAKRFCTHISAIVMEEGFSVHFRKTRVMRQSTRQRLAGVIVNENPNISRADFDRLKATLHNCIRFGPNGQNRDQHDDFRAFLLGQIAYVKMLNPVRGHRLQSLFQRISW